MMIEIFSYILSSARSRETSGPDIIIDCYHCGAENVKARTYELDTVHYIFGIIPGSPVVSRHVQCCNCSKSYRVKASYQKLLDTPPFAMHSLLKKDISFVSLFLAVVCLPLSIFPIIGLTVALSAYFGTKKAGGWPRKISVIALVISSIITLLTTVILVVDSFFDM